MKINYEKMQLLMVGKCWTLAELQRKAGLSNTTLYQLMKGGRQPTTRTIGKIAKALEVDPVKIIKE